MDKNDVLYFDKMLTPTIITFVYWLLLVAAVIAGLTTLFSAGGFLKGVFYLVGGVIGARIGCELLIVVFKINEALQEMRKKA